MEEEELATALAAQQQPSSPGANHGRIVRRANGTYQMWQEPISGRGGRFVTMSEATATPEARRAIAADRTQLGVLTQIAPLAARHNQLNSAMATGGARQRAFARASAAHENPNSQRQGWNFMAGFLSGPERAQLQTMRGLESEAVKASIMPGQGGQSNTMGEQQLFRGRFPEVSLLGDANAARTAGLFVSRDIQRARVAAAEQWLTQHPDLGGFSEEWAQEEARLRPQLEAQYGLRFPTSTQRGGRTTMRPSLPITPRANTGSVIGAIAGERAPPRSAAPQAPPRPRNVPPNFVWNPRDRTWDEPD